MPRGRRGAVLPRWIPADHPLHLNKTLCRRIARNFDANGIFLNIPYSEEYSNLELAILSTATAYGLRPRMARERVGFEARLLKIVELMLACRYGLTDLTYVKRMNMALELGLLMAFGKENFVMSGQRYGAIKRVSDLNFADIHYHEGKIRRLILGFSLWIEKVCRRKRQGTELLLRRYRHWRLIHGSLGDDFDRYSPQEIAAMVDVLDEEFKAMHAEQE